MTTAEVHASIADYCAEIAKMFRPGAKVTVIVRNPEFDKEPHSAAMLVGDDDLDSVSAAVGYLKQREEKSLANV